MKRLWLLIPMAVLLVGCTRTTAPGQPEAGDTQQGEPFSGTLKAAMLLGVPMKCSYTLPDGTAAEGVIQGKNYRGTMMSQGKVGTVLIKDNCMWSWEEGSAQGAQMCFEPEAADESLWEGDETGTGDINYTCLPTVVTGAEFEPPTSVSFLNLDEMMGGQMSEEQLQQLQEMGE